MGALYASCADQAGALEPNMIDVERATGISNSTLHRWWHARDMSEDGAARDAMARARATVAGEGAEAWLRQALAKIRGRLDELLDDTTAFQKAAYDERARGLSTASKAAVEVSTHLGILEQRAAAGGDSGDGTGAVDERVRAALRRAAPG